jgi:hypothetical protein
MDWKNVKVPAGCRLFRGHTFTFMRKGVTYNLGIDEYSDGSFTGHGEHSTDKNLVIEAVNGVSLADCVNALIAKIEKRG